MAKTRRRGRLFGLRKATSRVWTTEFQMKMALFALERYDRLGKREQRRFRELAERVVRNGGPPLSPSEDRELKTMWKRLEARQLLRDALLLATEPEPRR
ncbi:MAG: hypothetical protein WKF94_08910 [Solirubrobacteraceae bacterium]